MVEMKGIFEKECVVGVGFWVECFVLKFNGVFK